MKIAILTSLEQWFVPYAKVLNKKLDNSKLFFNHKDIDNSYDTVFILSYHCLIEKRYLELHKYNLVIHASALPKGKGWAPIFWQILEGKNSIPFTMFEASQSIDDGDIYMQKYLELTGYELNVELRYKQAQFSIDMCIEFVNNFDKFKNSKIQVGDDSFYKKRIAEDSQLDINKTIKEQFNLFRIVNNNDYPAFFEINNVKYKIKIEEMNDENW